ncbi:MAG: hypothetical protein KJN92_15155, partial [Gemmatimonadetes bacterium]|nr:hypothetical protein [Gemmatimonadota bacterium]
MTQESSGSPDVDQIRDLEEDRLRRRLLAVERETERLRGRARIFGIGLLVSLVLAAVATLSPHLLALGGNSVDLDTVTARRMVLVDSEGVQRGEWRVDEEGNSRLRVLDRRSRTRLSFSVLSDGSPGLSLTNANGKRRAGLAL